MVYTRDQQTFSVKGLIVRILGTEGPTVSITAARGCHCRAKAATDNNDMGMAVFRFFTKIGGPQAIVCQPLVYTFKNTIQPHSEELKAWCQGEAQVPIWAVPAQSIRSSHTNHVTSLGPSFLVYIMGLVRAQCGWD